MKFRIFPVILVLLLTIAAAVSCVHNENGSASHDMPDVISYNFQIRPVLSDKCFKCHGPDANKREAGLRLDIADSAYAELKENKGAYAVVPGKPESSELYKRISSGDTTFMMPPVDAHLGALSTYEIALFKKWIRQGARYETHWAFTAPKKTVLPTVSNPGWPKTPIDYFVLSKMDQAGLKPNPEADRERLLKRICFDITGLPPDLAMMKRFMADQGAGAYEKMVDELLQTPQYGEKMALHWLDVARYADSYGYQDDNIRTQWPWRDWVIHAFNINLPYDRFVTWQIAGDMLPGATDEQILATAFFRNHKFTEEGGVIPEEYRVEYLIDKTKTYGKGILGVTIECAQCHDHKYDPFSQKDYYRLMAFFNNTREPGFEGDVSTSKPAKTPILKMSDTEVRSALSFINKPDMDTLTVSVMGERDTMRPTFVLNRGVYSSPRDEVRPAAINAVMRFDSTRYSRNRLGLAKWTTDRNNPLTARVFVNQLWQEIFGRGIVKTSGDFGMQGELPTHPALLDWLAVDFMENGWNIKRLVKQIVLSATYRQSAAEPEDKLKTDPENIYLSRAPRLRLPAEFVRDMVLASSGLLVKTIGGPSVKPYQPKGLWEAATSGRGVLATYKQDHGDSLYRRGMYTFIKLTVPPPSMGLFDASNRDQCEVKRGKTNTPLQALMMLNDPTVLEAARVLAQRLETENTPATEKVQTAFHLVVCRVPTAKEMAILNGYYAEQLQQFQQHRLDAAATIHTGEYPMLPPRDVNSMAALMKVIMAVYNLEESITKS